MKTIKLVISVLTFSGLAIYSLFLIPSANADYYGYSNARDYYGNSSNNLANYSQNYNDPYRTNYYDDSYYGYWPGNANWLNDRDWFNRSDWQYQNNWFNSQYNNLNNSQCRNNYYRNNNSAIWKSQYNNGNRRLYWNRSNVPMFNLRNYNSRNWVYANQYSNNYLTPSYARAIAIIDASNSNNAIVIINASNYGNGYSSLNRANVVVSSAMFNDLLRAIDNIGSNCNMNLDCQNNYLRYGDGNTYNYGYAYNCRGI